MAQKYAAQWNESQIRFPKEKMLVIYFKPGLTNKRSPSSDEGLREVAGTKISGFSDSAVKKRGIAPQRKQRLSCYELP